MMKNLVFIFSFIVCFVLSSCEYDNYDPPQLNYAGKLTYNGNPFLYDGNPNLGIVKFVQSGFGKVDTGIQARVDSDGNFNQLLFSGDYKMTLANHPYPFEFDDFKSLGAGLGYDSIPLDMSKNITKEFLVKPYYEISNLKAELSGLDVVANFDVKKVENTIRQPPTIVKARLYLSTSKVVNSATTAVGESSVNLSDDGSLRVPLSIINYRNAYKNNFRDYAFYRVAIELDGIPDYYLFSDVKKIEDIPVEFNDVTEDYLKNYKREFKIETMFDDRRGKVADWNVTSEVEPTMYDGWEGRRFMGAENWCGGSNDLDGGVWQTITLPSGNYIFLGKRGFNTGDLNGGTNHAFLAVAKGDKLNANSKFLGKADLGDSKNEQTPSVTFQLSQKTEISLGYYVHFPAGECNAISFTSFSIIKTD